MSTTVPANGNQVDLGRILVPLDGSGRSERALDLAARLPAREVILFHVGKDDDDRSRLESLAQALRTGQRSVEVEIRSGDASGEILKAAANYDLVVMATQGRGAAGRLLFGSTADRVSQQSGTPTLLVRTTKDAAIPVPARVVVPLDGSGRAEGALPIATTLARAMSLPLWLMRAVDLNDVRGTIHEQRERDRGAPAPGDAEHTYEEARQLTEQRATSYLADTAEPLAGQGFQVETSILRGTPVFELLRVIQPEDLVVMTSHGHQGFQRVMLGSVAEKLVRESTAPVLLVPTREPAGSLVA